MTGATRSIAGRRKASLAIAPAITLEDGLRKTFAWYLANEAWWRAVMDGSYRNWLNTQYSIREVPARVRRLHALPEGRGTE